MPFLKIDRRLFDHHIWHRKPFGPGQAWVDLISLAAWRDHNVGLKRDVKRGQLWTTLRWLGNRWGWSKDRVSRFLCELEGASMVLQNRDTTRDTGGTLISIINYTKYQDLQDSDKDGRDTERDTNETQTRHKRANQKNRYNRNTSSSTDAEEFENWYACYPRKTARGAAEKAFRTARKTADLETLVNAAWKYAKQVQGKDPQYIKHPASWLNGKCWLDESPPDPNAVRYVGFEVPAEELFKDVPECYKQKSSSES